MGAQRTGTGRVNALKRELVIRVEERSAASADAVYDVLSDLRSHAIWAGERQGKKTRLTSIDALEGPAVVGTEFTTTGADPMGSFRDTSVVTEASPPGLLEFVTEATLTLKKGATSQWTLVHRYEIAPDSDGSRITYTERVTRMSDLPGTLGIFNVKGLSGLVLRFSKRITRKSVRNLARLAEERASARGKEGAR
jgi:hypothetical protein